MLIREMTFDDLDQVMEIENATFSVPWTEMGYFTFLIREDTLFLVAEENEEILGYCGIVMAQDEGDITNVAVKESRRKQGVGTGLVQKLLDESQNRGIKKVFLEVRAGNTKAIPLYEKLGFENVGIRKNYYQDPVEDAIIMKHE